MVSSLYTTDKYQQFVVLYSIVLLCTLSSSSYIDVVFQLTFVFLATHLNDKLRSPCTLKRTPSGLLGLSRQVSRLGAKTRCSDWQEGFTKVLRLQIKIPCTQLVIYSAWKCHCSLCVVVTLRWEAKTRQPVPSFCKISRHLSHHDHAPQRFDKPFECSTGRTRATH